MIVDRAGLARLRGKPSRMKPSAASGFASRSDQSR